MSSDCPPNDTSSSELLGLGLGLRSIGFAFVVVVVDVAVAVAVAVADNEEDCAFLFIDLRLASQVLGGDIRIEEALYDRAVVAIEPVLHSTKWGQRGAQRGRIR